MRFDKERALHDLVAEAPELLPLAGSPRLAVVGREPPLGSGYPDLLAVELSGRLVVIEVKLAANAEARRAVVPRLSPTPPPSRAWASRTSRVAS